MWARIPQGWLDFSPRGQGRVIFITVAGTLLCIIVALAVDSVNFMQRPEAERWGAIWTNIALPLLLGTPMLYLLTSKIRQLAIAQHELSIVASTDSLTTLLNRGAFTTLVDAYLQRVTGPDGRATGALLIIDADHFKSINDRFGHDRGDEALKILAMAIKGTLRGVDLVGRLGGEEFGVFLPGTTAAQAEIAAERIRRAVSTAEFRPDGKSLPLSVSVGGVTFAETVSFSDLYRLADQEMYEAKQNGRNRIELAELGALSAPQALQPTLH
jgi:diguanylate cyclase